MSDISETKEKTLSLALWLSSIEKRVGPLSKRLKYRINHHFMNFWKNEKIKSFMHYASDNKIDIENVNDVYFNILPENIQFEVLKIVTSDFIYSFQTFFRHFGNMRYKLALFFLPRIFEIGEFLLGYNKKPNEIIFTKVGYLSIGVIEGGANILNSESDWKEITSFNERFIVGDYSLFKGLKSFVGFRAKSIVKGYSLSAEVIKKFLKKYKINIEPYIKEIEINYIPLLDESKKMLKIDSDIKSFMNKIALSPEKKFSILHQGFLLHNYALSKIGDQKKNLSENEDLKKLESRINRFRKLRKFYREEIKEKALLCLKRKFEI